MAAPPSATLAFRGGVLKFLKGFLPEPWQQNTGYWSQKMRAVLLGYGTFAPVGYKRKIHLGIEQLDPFAYMDSYDERTFDVVQLENWACRRQLTGTRYKEFHDDCFDEIGESSRTIEMSAMREECNGWVYFTRTSPSQAHAVVFARKLVGDKRTELDSVQIISQWFNHSDRHVYIVLLKPSDNNRYVAFLTKVSTSNDRFMLHVKDMNTQELYSHRTAPVSTMEWTAEGTLLYTTMNDLNRPNKVWEHRPGKKLGSEDFCIFEYNEDEKYFLDLSRTKDREWNLLYLNSKTECVAYILPRSIDDEDLEHLQDCVDSKNIVQSQGGNLEFRPPRSFARLSPESFKGRINVEHNNGVFYYIVSEGRSAFTKVLRQEVRATAKHMAEGKLEVLFEAAKVIVDGKGDFVINDIDMLKGYLILYEYECMGSTNRLRLLSIDKQTQVVVNAPEGTVLDPGANADHRTDVLRLLASNAFVQPVTIDYNLKEGSFRVVHDAAAALQTEEDEGDNGTNEMSDSPPSKTDDNESEYPKDKKESRTPSSNVDEIATRRFATALGARHGAFWGAGETGYTVEKLWVDSTKTTGVKIPITLLKPSPKEGAIYTKSQWYELKKKKITDRTHIPTLIFVYGAYGEILQPKNDPFVDSLIMRGWQIAYFHCRGGGELGLKWHEQGSLRNKWNTFHDFDDCLSYLYNNGISHPTRTAVHGASAGALVPAVAVNEWPKRESAPNPPFAAMILMSPFLDPCTVLKDKELPYSEHDADEWGNVESVKEDFDYVSSWSPYENLGGDRVLVPSILAMSCLDDVRAPSWNALKYVSLCRKLLESNDAKAFEPDHRVIAARIEDFGGHSGVYRPSHTALRIVFLHKALKLLD